MLRITILLSLLYMSSCTTQKSIIQPIYTCKDVIYVDYKLLTISFEAMDTTIKYNDLHKLIDAVEDLTATASVPSGYIDDLNYQIKSGYVTVNVHPWIDAYDGKVISPVGSIELHYYGPNWGYDSQRDTSFLMGSFNTIESFNAEYDEFLPNTYTMYVGSENWKK